MMSSCDFNNRRKEAKTEEDEYRQIFAKQLTQCLQSVAIAANNLVEVIDNPYILSNTQSCSPQERPSTPNNIPRKVIDTTEYEPQQQSNRFIEEAGEEEVNKEHTCSDNNRQFIPQGFRSPPNPEFIFLEQLNAYEKTKKLVHNLVNDRFDGLMDRFDKKSKQREVRRTIRYMNFRDKIQGESLNSFMKRFEASMEPTDSLQGDKSSENAMEEARDIKKENSRTTQIESCQLVCSENVENNNNIDGPGEGSYSNSSRDSLEQISEIQNNSERNVQNQDLQTSKHVKHTKKLHGLLRRISFLSKTLKVLKK